jgi:hypothetical protein
MWFHPGPKTVAAKKRVNPQNLAFHSIPDHKMCRENLPASDGLVVVRTIGSHVRMRMADSEVRLQDDRTKCPTPDKMSDRQLVNFVGKQFTKFLLEMRPYLIEVHTRFLLNRANGKPFLGHTDWDKFCVEVFAYTGRHVRRIISGDGLPRPRKRLANERTKKPTISLVTVWTDHDFIHRATQSLKQILLPLESDPVRYSKVAAAISEEIIGDGFVPHQLTAEPSRSEEAFEEQNLEQEPDK